MELQEQKLLQKKVKELEVELKNTKEQLIQHEQYKDLLSIASIDAAIKGDNEMMHLLFEVTEKIKDLSIKRGRLLGKRAVLDNDRKVAEADAMMSEEFTALKNQATRDAFRREASATERQQLASCDASIAMCDSNLMAAREEKNTLTIAINGFRAKMSVQCAVFHVLK